MDPRAYWVGFNYVKGIGAVRFKALLNFFGDAQKAWAAPTGQLIQAGLSPKLVENIHQIRSQVSLEQIWERLESQNIQVLTWEDGAYPTRLKEIDQPPPVLYLRGTLASEDEWAVAIVGTRRVTPYGRQVTEELARTLAGSGVTIVSGLARGVDAIAHQAALKANGRTLAVLGSGVDQVYPPEHRKLAEEMSAGHGGILSDYHPGTPPDSTNFPPRNRIISGLSLAVVVIEAGETSGALITARFAAEQGRDVFGVPGNIYAPQSKGSNRLIQQGAHVLLNAQDVLEVLNLNMISEHKVARQALPNDPTERQLYQLLSAEPAHVDEICQQAELPIEIVSAALAMMELKGMVRQVAGMNYVAVREEAAEYQTFESDESI